MDLGTAVVTLGVAAIAFAGGYCTARWQARNDLAQWRRERLLEFCADQVAAGGELPSQRTGKWKSDDIRLRRCSGSAMQSLAFFCSGELTWTIQSSSTRMQFLDALNQTLAPDVDPQKEQQARKTAVERQAHFLWLANNLLLDVPHNPHRWWQFWSRTSSEQLAAKGAARS